jgi:hypothetical protein
MMRKCDDKDVRVHVDKSRLRRCYSMVLFLEEKRSKVDLE